MLATSPEHAIELLDAAFNAGDVATVLHFYDDAAVVLPEPGREARGHTELKRLYEDL